MQAMTRNPLASPGLFGVNAGAIFFIVLSSVWIGAASLATLVWSGFLGAAVAGDWCSASARWVVGLQAL